MGCGNGVKEKGGLTSVVSRRICNLYHSSDGEWWHQQGPIPAVQKGESLSPSMLIPDVLTFVFLPSGKYMSHPQL